MTSAEAVLVSLQSHSEVLNALDSHPSVDRSLHSLEQGDLSDAKLFVASVSPQVRASLAATYAVSEQEAGWMIDQLLGGPQGLASGGKHGNGFAWIVDTNAMREVSLVLGAEEVMHTVSTSSIQEEKSQEGASTTKPKKPILSSACPGWICYAEKTHPHVLPHLSRLKSPQALTGTLLKTVLSQHLSLRPEQIWHVSVMPCFDKKLEASREELTDIYWRPPSTTHASAPVRDVDCVITARELLMLADTRGVSFPNLPRQPLSSAMPFPDSTLSTFIFPKQHHLDSRVQAPEAGTSGGYLRYILQTQLSLNPGSTLTTTRGRNADVVEYSISPSSDPSQPIFKAARYYGFRNIQNLVRKLKPAKKSRLPGGRVGARAWASQGLDLSYVEVMACPGGCTNGGGQIKVDDVPIKPKTAMTQKQWLGKVDEAYYSMSESSDDDGQNLHEDGDVQMGSSPKHQPFPTENIDAQSQRVKAVLGHWSSLTGIELHKLVTTSYRKVESEVGKVGGAENERVVELAGKIGGGW